MSGITSVRIPLALPNDGGPGGTPGDGTGGPGGPSGPGRPDCPEKTQPKDRDSRHDKMRKRVAAENMGANTARNACNFDGDPNTKWVPAHISNGQVVSGACMIKK